MDPRPIQDLLSDLGLSKPVCRRVLLVDDEFEVLAVLEALLDDDWDVTTAQSGSDALEVLNGEETIDLIITDQRMPEMTGVELLQRVSDSHPDLYRMVLTAYSDVDPIVAAINQGKVDQFILKPWDPSAIRRLVAEGLAVCERRATMRAVVDALGRQHEDHTATIDHLKVTQGVKRAESWLSVAGWMGASVAEEAEHLLLAASPALASLSPTSEARTALSRARALREDLARLSAPPEATVVEEIATRKLISDAVRLLMGDDSEASNPVHVDIEPGTETLSVRIDAMRQALLNLLRNARQASGEGVPIQVKVRKSSTELVRIEVVDQGIGMGASSMRDATTPFFSDFEPQSNGLGLSLCQLVSELHGGKLALLDNEPQGTIAQIWLRTGLA